MRYGMLWDFPVSVICYNKLPLLSCAFLFHTVLCFIVSLLKIIKQIKLNKSCPGIITKSIKRETLQLWFTILLNHKRHEKRLNESSCVQVDEKHYIRAGAEEGRVLLVIISCNWVCMEFVCEPVLLQHRPLWFWVCEDEATESTPFPGPLCGELLTQNWFVPDNFFGGHLRVLIEVAFKR